MSTDRGRVVIALGGNGDQVPRGGRSPGASPEPLESLVRPAILTDVVGVGVHWGTAEQRWLERGTPVHPAGPPRGIA